MGQTINIVTRFQWRPTTAACQDEPGSSRMDAELEPCVSVEGNIGIGAVALRLVSFSSFSVGAMLPLLPWFFTRRTVGRPSAVPRPNQRWYFELMHTSIQAQQDGLSTLASSDRAAYGGVRWSSGRLGR
jgi:hypothetical protein